MEGKDEYKKNGERTFLANNPSAAAIARSNGASVCLPGAYLKDAMAEVINWSSNRGRKTSEAKGAGLRWGAVVRSAFKLENRSLGRLGHRMMGGTRLPERYEKTLSTAIKRHRGHASGQQFQIHGECYWASWQDGQRGRSIRRYEKTRRIEIGR